MEGLDKSLPFSEGMIDAEQAGAVPTTEQKRYCLNCNTELTDVYCPHCGQKDIPKRQTLGELLANFISSFWSYESKFFRTGQYLLLRPGFLAIEYTEGRRDRYYHPARMYVFISFIYFLLFSTLPDSNNEDPDFNKDNAQKAIAFNEYGTMITVDTLSYTSIEQYDSLQQTLPADKRDGWFGRLLAKREVELTKKYKEDGKSFEQDFASSFTANFPKIFFFLLPVFAALLKLLYIRRDYYYSEHLVFSIYFYNFFFLAGSLYMLLDLVPWLEWATIAVNVWLALYLLIAMKIMYKQKWGKTILKYCIFFFTFLICVGIGLFVNLMITLLYI